MAMPWPSTPRRPAKVASPSTSSWVSSSVGLALQLRALVVADLLAQVGEAVAELDVASGQRLDQGRELLRREARQLDRSRLRPELPDEQDADDERHGEEAELREAGGHQSVSGSGAPQRRRVLPMNAGSVSSSRASLANWSP